MDDRFPTVERTPAFPLNATAEALFHPTDPHSPIFDPLGGPDCVGVSPPTFPPEVRYDVARCYANFSTDRLDDEWSNKWEYLPSTLILGAAFIVGVLGNIFVIVVLIAGRKVILCDSLFIFSFFFLFF